MQYHEGEGDQKLALKLLRWTKKRNTLQYAFSLTNNTYEKS